MFDVEPGLDSGPRSVRDQDQTRLNWISCAGQKTNLLTDDTAVQRLRALMNCVCYYERWTRSD